MTDTKTPRKHKLPCTLLTAAATVVLCLGAQAPIASAQARSVVGQPDVAETAHLQQAVWPAPVGTRQPTEADLPPAMRRDEGAIRPEQRKFDKSLTICRGC